MDLKENAVLGDVQLQEALNGVNPKFGDFCVRVAGEAWGHSLIDQKTKAMFTILLDVANQSYSGPGIPFEAHVTMSIKQGISFEEIEEIQEAGEDDTANRTEFTDICHIRGPYEDGSIVVGVHHVNDDGDGDVVILGPNSEADEVQGDFSVILPVKRSCEKNRDIFTDYWSDVDRGARVW